MAGQYVCPGCLHNINPIFALPPVRATVSCGHCGHPVIRSIGAVAECWARFFAFFTLIAVWASLLLVNPQSHRGAAEFTGWAVACFVFAGIAALLAGVVGGVMGGLIGMVIGAAWGAPVIRAGDVQRIVTPGGGSGPTLPHTTRDRLVMAPARPAPMRCWHCGCGFEVPPSREPTTVHCPRCKAGLGTVTF